MPGHIVTVEAPTGQSVKDLFRWCFLLYLEGIMTRLLLRLFVKNYQNTSAPHVRTAIGKLAGLTGIVCNFLLFVLKLTAGLLSGAVSIVADAMNNLSDAASSVVTLFGFWLAQRPADRDHPYGHARYEYLSGLIVAALILVIGMDLGESAVRRIFQPAPVELTGLTFAILLCSTLVKLWMCLFYRKTGKIIGSATLKAASLDSRNDVITTLAVLVGCLVQRYFDLQLDGYVGLLVSVFILWSGIGIAKETISPLLGQRADRELTDRISKRILSCPKVLGMHDLLVHDYGPGQCFASAHVEVSAEEEPMACHDLIDAIENDVLENLQVHLVIHYDPVVTDDKEWNQMRQAVSDIIAELDSRLSMHDFRIIRGANHTKLVFDLSVPYDMQEQKRELKRKIDRGLQERSMNYTTLIHFDEY